MDALKNLIMAMYDAACGDKLIEDTTDILSISDCRTSIGGAFSGFIDGGAKLAYTSLTSVALSLIVMYFLFSITDKVAQGQMTIEIFVPEFIKLLAAAFLVLEGYNFFKLLISLGESITKTVGNSFTNDRTTNNLRYMVETNADDSAIVQVSVLAVLIIPTIFGLLARLSIYVVCIGRALEIIVRLALSPIAVADVFGNGLNSGGFRYIKKFLAVTLQGAVIVVIIHIMGTLNATLAIPPDNDTSVSALFGNLMKVVFVNLAGVSLIIKSQSIVNDVIGV